MNVPACRSVNAAFTDIFKILHLSLYSLFCFFTGFHCLLFPLYIPLIIQKTKFDVKHSLLNLCAWRHFIRIHNIFPQNSVFMCRGRFYMSCKNKQSQQIGDRHKPIGYVGKCPYIRKCTCCAEYRTQTEYPPVDRNRTFS